MYFTNNSFGEVMTMPIYTFFEISRNISRINAKRNLDNTKSTGAAFSGDKKYISKLQESVGDIFTGANNDFDRNGFENLRRSLL